MKHVGVRELQNSLSAYIRHVKKGETVVVTERGKTIATLKREPSNLLEQRLQALQAKGVIRLGEGGKLPRLNIKLKNVKGAPLSDAVLKDRR